MDTITGLPYLQKEKERSYAKCSHDEVHSSRSQMVTEKKWEDIGIEGNGYD